MRRVTRSASLSNPIVLIFFFFNDTATTEIYTLSLHDALPISPTERKASQQFLYSQIGWLAPLKDGFDDIWSQERKLQNAPCVALVNICELGYQSAASKLSTHYPLR